MHPILIEFGDVSLRTYGLMAAIGLLSGIWIASREAGRLGEDKDRIIDMAFYMVIAAIIGSRVLYVILEWDYFSINPGEIVKIWRGGLVFYGGLIGAVIVGSVYIKVYSLPFWKTADIFALGIPLGHAFGRLGCFAAGCCYGLVTMLPWGVKFTHSETLVPESLRHLHLHPTQLYSSLSNLVIFAILMLMRKKKKFHGQLLLTYLILYSIARGTIEMFRGDDRGAVLLGYLSPAQIIGIIIVVAASAGMVWLSNRESIQK